MITHLKFLVQPRILISNYHTHCAHPQYLNIPSIYRSRHTATKPTDSSHQAINSQPNTKTPLNCIEHTNMSEPLPTGVWIGMAIGAVVVLGMLFWVIRSESCCGRSRIGDAEG